MSTTRVAALPSDLQQVLDHIDEADRAADTLVVDLSDRQFHWQPDEGKSWSIAQCLEHLGATNVLYGNAIRGAWTRRGGKGGRARGHSRRVLSDGCSSRARSLR